MVSSPTCKREWPGLAGRGEENSLHRGVKQNQPLVHARVKALSWRQVSADSSTRDTGHGRIETRSHRGHKDVGYLHVPDGRRDHITPAETPPPRP
jgi:hypothetical protein